MVTIFIVLVTIFIVMVRIFIVLVTITIGKRHIKNYAKIAKNFYSKINVQGEQIQVNTSLLKKYDK